MIDTIVESVRRLKTASLGRDQTMREIRQVRSGDISALYPDVFSEDWPKPIVANSIDQIARDLAEVIAPLPALNCSSRGMRTSVDKKKAGEKNKIGSYYWAKSKLATQMFSAADRYLTYGFLPFFVELDFAGHCPVIRAEDPFGCYYENDRWGETRKLARTWTESATVLAGKFPEHAGRLLMNDRGLLDAQAQLEVIRYSDTEHTTLYVPQRKNLVLASYANLVGRCPAQVAEVPGLTGKPAGQFDQVMWVQLARAKMALLTLEAADKSVKAPTIVPRDMNELPIGPDAVWRTDNGQSVRRLSLEVPSSAFALGEQLSDEMKAGARYPEGRMGGIDASVITGRGVQALMGGFDTQIKTAQTILGAALATATEIAFEYDAKAFGGRTKTIYGIISGDPFELTYDPGKTIGDNFTCDVTYGFAAGLAPNQAVVMLLQLRGDEIIDRDTFRRNLPFDIDVTTIQQALDVEQIESALKQGMFAMLQGIGPMAAQGMDPLPFLVAAAKVIKDRQSGKALAQAIEEAFTPPPPTEEELAAQQLAQTPEGQLPPGGSAPSGVGPDGLPADVAPGQAGMAPGGAPDIMTLLAGLQGGKPKLDAAVSRRLPIAS